MPTYEYKREDGSTFEIEQRITAPSLTVCPTTGQKVKRIISSGAGLVFKGSGFYQTDYVRKSGESKSGDQKSKSTTAANSDGQTAAKASESTKATESATAEPTTTGSNKDTSGS